MSALAIPAGDGRSSAMLRYIIMTRWEILIELIQQNGYTKIAEIGVYRGRTTRKILLACARQLDRYLLVDPVKCLQLEGYVWFFPAVDYQIMTSEQAQVIIMGYSFDLIFLDALHTKQDVKDDIRWWMPKIRHGGILCGDDYGQAHCEGVKQAVDEVFGDRVELRPVGRKGNHVWIVRV